MMLSLYVQHPSQRKILPINTGLLGESREKIVHLMLVLMLCTSINALAINSSFSTQFDVEIVTIDTGRYFYERWFHIDSFAITSDVEIKTTLKNNLLTSLDVVVTVVIMDDANYGVGFFEKTASLPEEGTQDVILGPLLIPNWARVGVATAHVNARKLEGTPYCPENSMPFYIIPPIYYSLTADTFLTTGEKCPYKRVWIDGALFDLPTTITFIQGTHILKVDACYHYLGSDNLVYTLFFKDWEDGSRTSIRALNVYSNITTRGYYGQIKAHRQPR